MGKDAKKEECRYCSKVNTVPLVDEFLAQAKIVFVQDVDKGKIMPLLDVNNSFCVISFCPVCGRDLNKEEE